MVSNFFFFAENHNKLGMWNGTGACASTKPYCHPPVCNLECAGDSKKENVKSSTLQGPGKLEFPSAEEDRSGFPCQQPKSLSLPALSLYMDFSPFPSNLHCLKRDWPSCFSEECFLLSSSLQAFESMVVTCKNKENNSENIVSRNIISQRNLHNGSNCKLNESTWDFGGTTILVNGKSTIFLAYYYCGQTSSIQKANASNDNPTKYNKWSYKRSAWPF